MNPIEIEPQIRALEAMGLKFHGASVSCAPRSGSLARLTREMTAYGKTWPPGTIIQNFRQHQRDGYCGMLPDGHHVTNILPDWIECQ